MRPGDRVREHPQRILGHAEIFECNPAPFLVEQPQDHALAVQRRHRGHPHVHLAVLQLQPDAAILRHAPLGDVQVRHDLEPADDRGLQVDGRCGRVLQHAVDAISHPQPVGVSFEVHVRGPRFERLEQQQVHELDDRSFVRQVDEVIEGNLAFARGVGTT